MCSTAVTLGGGITIVNGRRLLAGSGVNSRRSSQSRYSGGSIEDGSYWRMQDVTFGWQLPENWAASARFATLRLYGSIHNLFIITNYSGYDPDVNSNGSAANISLATDFYAYPQERSFVLGLQAGW